MRGVLIGGLGLAGGVIGGAQVLSSGLADRLAVITHHSREVAAARLEAVAGSLLLPGGISISPELAAMSLVLVAVGRRRRDDASVARHLIRRAACRRRSDP